MSPKAFFIRNVDLDPVNRITWNNELEEERKSAVFDLLNNGFFKIKKKNHNTGPFFLNIKLLELKLYLSIKDLFDGDQFDIILSISPLRRIIRDYRIVCENYIDAIKEAPIKKIEAIDIGRKSIHDEGSTILKSILEDKLDIDLVLCRKLFTLISIISIKA